MKKKKKKKRKDDTDFHEEYAGSLQESEALHLSLQEKKRRRRSSKEDEWWVKSHFSVDFCTLLHKGSKSLNYNTDIDIVFKENSKSKGEKIDSQV